ncbi:MAG TPA: DUF559 domain-containing protein [Mycobacteriales bacterium]|nr:DUF559 domain-containing protein [Mycobacteriales bacterium]
MALTRISRGVWLPQAAAQEPVARLAALLTALPEGSVLSGRTAAALHGLWVPAAPEVDVTVPARTAPPSDTTGPRRRGVPTHRRALSVSEQTLVAGLPVTTPARTWYDLAAELPLADLVAAGDSALRTGLVQGAELAAGLADRGGRRGTALARTALPLLDERSRSRPETHARVALARAGLPAPAVNRAVHDEHGQWLAEPDLSWEEARLALEYQGADHADARRLRRDLARHMDLRRAGWDVLYYTAEQVFGRLEIVVADVRAALARRSPGLLATAARRAAQTRVRSRWPE